MVPHTLPRRYSWLLAAAGLLWAGVPVASGQLPTSFPDEQTATIPDAPAPSAWLENLSLFGGLDGA